MSKIKRLKKRFAAFVNQLTPDQVREQLILAYLQMETCKKALKGYDVEPVEMMDNGECSDLELFYSCKKAAEELAYLNNELSKPETMRGNPFVLKVDISKYYEPLHFDTSDPLSSWKELRKCFERMKFAMRPKVLDVGTEVYFLSKGRIHKSTVKEVVGLVAGSGEPCCYVNGHDNVIPASYLYDTAVRLASTIGKLVNNHVSVSSDHESAFFIDSTSRVFKAAKWYLEDQKIEHFNSINDLRKFLLQNIVEDKEKK